MDHLGDDTNEQWMAEPQLDALAILLAMNAHERATLGRK